MNLRPRHYILLAVVIGLFIFNIVRHRRDQRNLTSTNNAPAPVVMTTPRINTPAWVAFDHAASLRDDPPATFAPALHDLQQLIPVAPNHERPRHPPHRRLRKTPQGQRQLANRPTTDPGATYLAFEMWVFTNPHPLSPA